MELELSKIDFTIVGITLSNSLKIIPSTDKRQQPRIVVGDQDGVVQILSIKKGEPKIQFKSLPGEKIASVQLGGALGTLADKIFVASENNVRGFNKKGKIFLSFDTNLAETIKCIFVSGSDLLVCGNHVYNHYRDCKETGSYLCGDAIVDLVALCPNNTSRIITALACSGRVLRLLEHCRVRQSIELESIPTVLNVPKKQFGDKLICGFSDGSVLLFLVDLHLTNIKKYVLVDKTINSSAITCIDTYDLCGDGKIDLILGRRDGSIEVFKMNLEATEDIQNECVQVYKNNFDESISSVQGGAVNSPAYPEIIVATYTGRIFSLTTQCISSSLSSDKIAATSRNLSDSMMNSADSQRVLKLQTEIEELEQIIVREREKYQQSTQSLSSDISIVPIIPINDSLTLNKADGCYTLSIEITSPIEYLLLQCDISLEIVDVEENTAMISFSACDPLSGNSVLATYQCQRNANNADVVFRTIEGYTGTLNVYVMPNCETKCAELKSYSIKPLSLHTRAQYNESNVRPFNELQLKGSFSQAEVYNWIKHCIPEVPEKIEAEEVIVYCFENVVIGTILLCEFRKGEVKFKSDNLSTISILKDFFTKEATKKRIKLEISTSVNELSITHMLTILKPELETIIKLKEDHQLLQALLELDIRNEDEFQILSPRYRDLLNNKNNVINDFKKYSSKMKQIYGLITDLYVDKYKFKSVNIKRKIPQLIEILDNYNFDELLNHFS